MEFGSKAGTSWLLPLVDGVPPIGWELATPYVALPVAVVLSQFISAAILKPDTVSPIASLPCACHVTLLVCEGAAQRCSGTRRQIPSNPPPRRHTHNFDPLLLALAFALASVVCHVASA